MAAVFGLWLGAGAASVAGFVLIGLGTSSPAVLALTVATCLVGWGWPGDADNEIRIPVREGFITWATVICP